MLATRSRHARSAPTARLRGRRPLVYGMGALVVLLATLVPVLASSGAASAGTAAGGPPPAVPSSGAYLGVWLNPNVTTTTTTADLLRSVQLLPQFDATIGRPLGFVHLFQEGNLNKHSPVSNGTLEAVAATGAVPMIDWPCTLPDTEITDGVMDTAITKFAEQLASYGGPVFLRWSWEMNLNKLPGNEECQGTAGAKGYVAAYRHIEQIIAPIASNVAFVWCPSVAKVAATPLTYFPGTSYVTWIGMDGYDRTSTPTQSIALWRSFYAKFSGYGKPMIVAETGAPNGASAPNNQADFLEAAAKALPEMPDIKGLGYYDSKTTSDNWTLDSSGTVQYRKLGETPYFSFISPLGGGSGT